MANIQKKIENLKPGKEYLLTVRAKNGDMNVLSKYADSIRFVVPQDSTVPGDITGLELRSNFEKVMFIFNAVDDVDLKIYEYELYSANTTNSAYLVVNGFNLANVFTVAVDNSSKEENIIGATPSGTFTTTTRTYWGRVRAIDTTGNASGWSSLTASDPTPLISEEFIDTLTASKITAGVIGAQTIVLNGLNSILKSSNYSVGSAGWKISGDGNAEFNNVKVRGQVDSSDFNLLDDSNNVIASLGPITVKTAASDFYYPHALTFNHLNSSFSDSGITWVQGSGTSTSMTIVGPGSASGTADSTTSPVIEFYRDIGGVGDASSVNIRPSLILWNDGVLPVEEYALMNMYTQVGDFVTSGSGIGYVQITGGSAGFGPGDLVDVYIGRKQPFGISEFRVDANNGFSGPLSLTYDYGRLIAQSDGITASSIADVGIGPWNGSGSYRGFVNELSTAGSYMMIQQNNSATFISTGSSTGNIYLRPGNNAATYQMFLSSTGAHTLAGDIYVSSNIKMADGAVGAPSLAFNLDIDSGIRRRGTNDFAFQAAGLDQFVITNAGIFTHLEPGGAALPAVRYDGVGQLFDATSNLRFKENIADLSGLVALRLINELRPRTFTWKPTERDSPEVAALKPLDVNIGFIVEEVAEAGKNDSLDLAHWRPPADLPELIRRPSPLEADLEATAKILEDYTPEEIEQFRLLAEAEDTKIKQEEQEWQEKFSDLSKWEPAYWKESYVIAILVAAVKELSTEIEQLKNTVYN